MSYFLNEITLRIKNLSETPHLDAQVLLSHIVGKSKSWVLAHPELKLSDMQQEKLNLDLDQMESGVPLPYILGSWEFYGMDLIISKDVLIPRPETELLVDTGLNWLKANPKCRKVIDMGTGSGCIAIALATHIPDLQVKAVDISENAIAVARENAEKYYVSDRIEFILGDLWEDKKNNDHLLFPSKDDQSSSSADLITANLPYIPTSLLHSLKVFGREPDLALDGGQDGLLTIRNFLKSAPLYLNPGGLLLLELEASLGSQTLDLVEINFPEAEIHLHQDLAGFDRLIEIRQKL